MDPDTIGELTAEDIALTMSSFMEKARKAGKRNKCFNQNLAIHAITDGRHQFRGTERQIIGKLLIGQGMAVLLNRAFSDHEISRYLSAEDIIDTMTYLLNKSIEAANQGEVFSTNEALAVFDNGQLQLRGTEREVLAKILIGKNMSLVLSRAFARCKPVKHKASPEETDLFLKGVM